MNNVFLKHTIFLALILLVSCRYRNNQSSKSETRVLFVETIRNNSLAPQVSSILNREIRSKIIRRGYFNLSQKPSEADLILSISLEDYRKNAEVYNPQDTLLAAGFKISTQATVSLTNRKGDLLIAHEIIRPTASVLRENSLSLPSERQALVAVSQNLSHAINQLIENYNWKP